MNLTTHQKRLATSLVLAPILVLVINLGGLPLLGALLLVTVLGLWEFYAMFWPGVGQRIVLKTTGIVLGGLMVWAAGQDRPRAILVMLLAGFVVECLAFLRDYERQDSAYGPTLILTTGLIYIPLILQFILAMSPREVYLVLFAAFLSDTGAYYAGSTFGKTRIWPKVSPNKTWAGSVGGLATCVLTCLGFGLGFGTAPLWTFAGLGLVLGVAAQVGDFFESAVKRVLGIKDSGRLLPGHGGILDRIDAMLFVLLAYAGLSMVHPFF